MDWWYFPQFLVENVCIQKKEFQTFRLKLFFLFAQHGHTLTGASP